jgi:hypothetical protein
VSWPSTSMRWQRATWTRSRRRSSPTAYAREPTGRQYVHRGRDAVRAFYERTFSNGGGIELEHCALVHDGRACALEYNVVRWGRTELPPEAGVAVYVQGEGGKDRRRPDLRRRRPADQLTSCCPPSTSKVAPVSAVLVMSCTASAATSYWITGDRP